MISDYEDISEIFLNVAQLGKSKAWREAGFSVKTFLTVLLSREEANVSRATLEDRINVTSLD